MSLSISLTIRVKEETLIVNFSYNRMEPVI